jgi:hypothetical protein
MRDFNFRPVQTTVDIDRLGSDKTNKLHLFLGVEYAFIKALKTRILTVTFYILVKKSFKEIQMVL